MLVLELVTSRLEKQSCTIAKVSDFKKTYSSNRFLDSAKQNTPQFNTKKLPQHISHVSQEAEILFSLNKLNKK